MAWHGHVYVTVYVYVYVFGVCSAYQQHQRKRSGTRR